jgi:hypothetical protein
LNLLGKTLLKLAVLVAVALGGGLGSAWYMIEAGSRLSTRSFGPWVTWTSAGRPDADPYTRAHVARNGLLPLSSTLELTFRAKTDSNGGRLTSACDYAVVMDDFDPAWWGLAVFDGQGRLVANAAERHGFSGTTVMREPDGRAVITLARDARPGNWLPSGRGSRVVLVLTVRDATWAAPIHEGGTAPKALPEVVRTGCR